MPAYRLTMYASIDAESFEEAEQIYKSGSFLIDYHDIEEEDLI